MSSGPLAGVTVIENASYISGPLAGLLVEAPGSGDPFRRWGGAASGVRVRPQFAALDHGRRSVALDLRTPEGRTGYLAATGEVEGPYSRGRRSHSIALRAGDGRPLAVHLSSPEKFWLRLTDVVGRPDLRDDERFATYPARLEHFDELRTELEAALAAEPRERWLERLHEADVPAAPIWSVDEVVTDPHVVGAGLLRQASGPAGERFLVPCGAIGFAGDLDACPMEVPALGG